MTQLRQRLDTDGYLFFRGFFDAGQVLAAREQVVHWLSSEKLLDERQPLSAARAAPHADILCAPENGHFPLVRDLLHSHPLLHLYERLLGGPVRVYDHIWMRLVSPGNVTGPHLDVVYAGRGTRQLYTSWVPIGDVPIEHGGLMILEGSSRRRDLWEKYARMDIDKEGNWRKLRFRHGRFFRGGDYSRNPRQVSRQSGLRWLTTDYRAGDLVVLTCETMHGSLDNVSDVIRICADTRYQLASEPADERWIGESPPGHSLAE